MAWDNTVITNKGLEMLRQAIDGGELTIVSASGSDETYPAASLMVQTTPANEKQTFNITEIRDMDNGIRVRVTITNDGLTKGYIMKQMCLWARLSESEEPQIIAISQDELGTAIPGEGEIASYLMQFYVLLKVDTATNMKIVVENSAFVTLDVVEELLKNKANLVNGKLPTAQLTIDNEPREGSSNPISSGGAKESLDKKQNSEDAFSGEYGDLQNIPESFKPSEHTHSFDSIDNKPESYPPSEHTHPYIPTNEKGRAGGVAGLNKDGKIKPEQLPEMNYVPTTLKINDKPLTSDIELCANDIGIEDSFKLIKSYTVAGAYTFTVPNGITEIVALFIGGGGSGGASVECTYSNNPNRSNSYATGGGSGHVKAVKEIVRQGNTKNIVVGKGGDSTIVTDDARDRGGSSGGSTVYNGNTALGGSGGGSERSGDSGTTSGASGGQYSSNSVNSNNGYTPYLMTPIYINKVYHPVSAATDLFQLNVEGIFSHNKPFNICAGGASYASSYYDSFSSSCVEQQVNFSNGKHSSAGATVKNYGQSAYASKGNDPGCGGGGATAIAVVYTKQTAQSAPGCDGAVFIYGR